MTQPDLTPTDLTTLPVTDYKKFLRELGEADNPSSVEIIYDSKNLAPRGLYFVDNAGEDVSEYEGHELTDNMIANLIALRIDHPEWIEMITAEQNVAVEWADLEE